MDQSSRQPGTPRLIGIVAATGGPQALAEILGRLPREFPVPILVIQSIHPDYLTTLITRLGERCPFQVTGAEEGQAPEPGRVYVASGDPCLVVAQGRLRLQCTAPGSRREPKNALFRSMARDQGPAALAAILSGMGADGAQGMREVRDAGGYTIVQDRATSVIYGTAAFADRLNAVCESLPLQEIAPRLLSLIVPGPPHPR
jgi:two-component system chemotaxis response regulator CheB